MIEQDITAIDSLIIHDTQANIDYLRQVAIHLTERQEPPLYQKILLLSLKMIDYQGQEHILSGVILEYIFAATKLHDDTMAQRISCQDEVLSQGVKSTDSRILIGDFFYSRAFSLMATMGKMNVVFHLSNAINQYTEGQSRQLLQAVDITTTEEMYFERLQQKSSLYFTSVAQVVAELGDCSEEQAQRLCDFSLHLGMAEQVIEETLCCIRGNQADQHKQPSLPFLVIRGLDQASPVLRQSIQSGIAQSSVTPDMIAQICAQTDALMYIHRYIEGEIKLAIESVVIFPESNYRQALQVLATDLLARFDQELAGLGFS